MGLFSICTKIALVNLVMINPAVSAEVRKQLELGEEKGRASWSRPIHFNRLDSA